MMKGQLTKFVIYLTYFCLIISADNPCRYETAHGTIDLTSLANDNTPRFQNIPTIQPSEYKYSYNPCKPFTQGEGCANVAGCQIANSENVRFSLGSQESAQWVDLLGGHVMLQYQAGDKILRVALDCDETGRSPEFEVLGEDPMNNYKFRLKHECACWNRCSGTKPATTTRGGGGGGGGGDSDGNSSVGGAVFLGLFFGLIAVYFIGFAIFYRVREQRSGLELVAHRQFWSGFGGYVKDGFVFTYQKITGKGPYQSV